MVYLRSAGNPVWFISLSLVLCFTEWSYLVVYIQIWWKPIIVMANGLWRFNNKLRFRILLQHIIRFTYNWLFFSYNRVNFPAGNWIYFLIFVFLVGNICSSIFSFIVWYINQPHGWSNWTEEISAHSRRSCVHYSYLLLDLVNVFQNKWACILEALRSG